MRRNHTAHPRAGFTLLEMMVVVAIIGILAAVAGTALIYGNGHARLNNTSFEIASLANVAQMRAGATGHPQYLIFYQKGTESGVVLLDRDERAGGPVPPLWNTVDPTVEATSGGQYADRVKWNSANVSNERAGLQWEPLSSFTALKQPWSAISIAPAGGAGLLQACSFCAAGGGGSTLGALRYGPDGTVTVDTNPALVAGGVVAMSLNPGTTGSKAEQELKRPKLFAFSTPTGAVKVFSGVNE